MSLDEWVSQQGVGTREAKQLVLLARKYNLSSRELKALLSSPKRQPTKSYKFNGKDVLYGVISDTHIGHQCFDRGLLRTAIKHFNKEKVDFVLHGGDICEGLYTSRPGHVFELDEIGADAQVDCAIGELSEIKAPIFAITGNHTWNTFWKMSGYDVGRRFEENIPNFNYLGNADGTVELDRGVKIQMLHPDGGTAYAISYRTQKIIESIEGGKKPDIMHVGHFHKAEYLFYRNVHAFQNGCLQSQTPFMKGKHIPAHKGFWIIRATLGRNRGVVKINPTFHPAYD